MDNQDKREKKSGQRRTSPDSGAKKQPKSDQGNSLRRLWDNFPKVLSGKQREIQIRRKIWIIFIPVSILFAAAAVRVVYLATADTESSTRSALSQFNYTVSTDVAKPGDILDANGLTLATSYSVYRLILDPSVMYQTEKQYQGSIRATAGLLSRMFGLDADDIIAQVEENADSQYLRYSAEQDDGTAGNVFISYDERSIFEQVEDRVNNPEDYTDSEGSTEESAASGEAEADAEVLEQTALVQEENETAGESDAHIAGVWFEEEMRRTYPYSGLASKLIGFTTRDTTEGLWGLQLYYNDTLQGTDGKSYSYINDNTDLERDVTPAVDGQTLQTTIDINLTRMIREQLDEWLSQTDENGNLVNTAKAINILAMDPNTGAIKAYVSSTDYDLNEPNNLDSFYSEEEQAVFAANQEAYDSALAAWQEAHSGEDGEEETSGEEETEQAASTASADGTEESTQASSSAEEAESASETAEEITGGSGASPDSETFSWDYENYPTTDYIRNSIWRNDMISSSYEPGSTGKVITYAAALEEGAVTEETPFTDTGSIQVGSTVINCHNKYLGGCGEINAEIGLENSCNVAFVGIGQALGVHNFVKYQKLFNLGQLTGVDLPGEISCEGLLFSEDEMTELDLATNSFGQCYNVTMLQMAAAFCAAINGGTYYRPYVVSAILNEDGTTAETVEPEAVRQVISSETSERVREALWLVVYGETGTGGRIPFADGSYLSGYEFIAKTGTAQKLPRTDEKYLISVLSAVPKDDPQLVLYVTIDEYGGELQADSYPAQQLTGEIWGAVLDYLGIYSDESSGVDQYRYGDDAAASDEQWNDGTLSMENLEGGPLGTPEPKEDDGTGSTDSSVMISPEDILNPDNALPDPSAE
ncbi:MAG: peptidoglycan D,D-transpeptidase FtsI family protein [Lachnospiraceae bacterium]